MSLNTLKHKTNALYLKNKNKSTSKNKYMKPQFMNCCNLNQMPTLVEHGFSINGGFRPNSYIGKQYLMSASNMLYNSNSNYIKPSVVNHSAFIRRKISRNKEIVKPIECGTNKAGNHSQGAYIEKIKSCNSDIFDINRDDKFLNIELNCKNCKEKQIVYTKNTKQPLSMNQYMDFIKKPCLKSTPKSIGIGNKCYV
jgi:hypothetical protein